MSSLERSVEIIAKDGAEFCYVIRAELAPDSTAFVTPPHFKQQVGFIAYPAGGEVKRHLHPSSAAVPSKSFSSMNVASVPATKWLA